MAADDPDDVTELDVDEEELDDEDSLPFSLDDEADVADDEDDDEDGGTIDLEAALAMDSEESDIVGDDDDDDEDDEDDVPVREGEFVCNGCHMVFRVTAMANTKARLCRDCA